MMSIAARHKTDTFVKLSKAGILKPIPFKPVSNQDSIWRTASLMLGWALETRYNDRCIPGNSFTSSSGFHYDIALMNSLDWTQNVKVDNAPITMKNVENEWKLLQSGHYGEFRYLDNADISSLKKLMLKFRSSDLSKFVMPRLDATQLFQYSPFKLQEILKLPENDPVEIIKLGEFIDLSPGGSLARPNQIGAASLKMIGAVNWNSSENQVLSRVGGVAFESKRELNEHLNYLSEAEKRDHRLIGQQQGLFLFSDTSPGSPFILPHGVRIIESIKSYLKQIYREYDYHEVITPLIFDKKLWETSGHWENYKDDMFVIAPNEGLDEEKNEFGLKPMNCPGHCIIYNSSSRSYRDLPIRYVENSPLHR